jgi:hypothetical protein
LYQRTLDKIQYIKDQGYNVMEMWECQWRASINRDPELSRFIENRKRPCDGLITMTEDQILAAVLNDQLLDALGVDLHVPDHLKPTCAEMSLILKYPETILATTYSSMPWATTSCLNPVKVWSEVCLGLRSPHY